MGALSRMLGSPNALTALLAQPSAMPAMTSQGELAGADEDGYVGAPGTPLASISSALTSPSAPALAPEEDTSVGVGDEDASALLSGLGPGLQESLGLDESASGGGGMGTFSPAGMPMPQAPVLDEESLYPTKKRAILQGVIPGLAAVFAGLTGGKMAAAGLLSGAAQGNERYNADLRQRGLLRYQKSQQQYARDVALYNQQWQHAKDRASILADYAKKAAEFDDPDVAKQWLLSQRKIAAQFGVDPLDAMPGGVIPGAKEKIAAQATKVYNDAMDQIRKDHPGSDFDAATMQASNMITFRGKRMTLGELAALGNIAKPVPGAPTGISSTKVDAQSIFEDHLDQIRSTGREPDAIERAQLRLQSLQEFAKASKSPPSDIDRRIAEARLALIQQQRAKLMAGGGANSANLNPSQIRYGLAIGDRYNDASKTFNLRAQSYDTIKALARDWESPENQIGLVFAWMKMLDPTSTVREGEQAQVRNARGVPESIRNQYNQLVAGQSLTQKQVLQIVKGAHSMYSSLAKGQQQIFDHAAQQLNGMQIPAGLFLSPQGSVDDAASYRTLSVDDELLQLPPGPRTKPTVSHETTAAPAPTVPGPAAVRASGARPTAKAPTPTAATPATGATRIVRDKQGKLYQVVGTDENGKLKTIPLDQYF